jgi:hypothetical protein
MIRRPRTTAQMRMNWQQPTETQPNLVGKSRATGITFLMRSGTRSVLLPAWRATTTMNDNEVDIRRGDIVIVDLDPFEVRVRAAESDFNDDSSIRVDQIRTVDIPERIQFVAGQLRPHHARDR